jgi:hypothetical protein
MHGAMNIKKLEDLRRPFIGNYCSIICIMVAAKYVGLYACTRMYDVTLHNNLKS